MTIRHGSEYTAVFVTEPSVIQNANTWGGRMRMRYGTSPGEVGLAQDDDVILFPIYKGERALMFNIDNDTNTASLTADIGTYRRAADGSFTQVSEAQFIAAAAVNTALNQLLPSIDKSPMTEDLFVGITLEAANPSDTADIRVVMYYVKD